MGKCNPAYNPKLGDRTVAGTSSEVPGEVTTTGEVKDMLEKYKEIENAPTPTVEQVRKLLPDYVWYDDDDEKLYTSPDNWNQKFGLTDSRKDIIQYRAGGHTKDQIVEMCDVSDSHTLNTLNVFDFLLHNEDHREHGLDADVCRLLMKVFVGPEREHPKYDTPDNPTCPDCGESFETQKALNGHLGGSYDCGPDTRQRSTADTDESDESDDVSDSVVEPDPAFTTEAEAADGRARAADGGTSVETPPEPSIDDLDVKCVSEVMDKDEWRELVRFLLNSDEDGTDEAAERLMGGVFGSDGPFQ